MKQEQTKEGHIINVHAAKDVYNAAMAEGWAEEWAKGWAEGWAEGRAEGREEVRKELALNMKQMGMEISDIIKITGLSAEEINNL